MTLRPRVVSLSAWALALGCATSSIALDAPRSDAPLGDASLEGCAPLELGLCTLTSTGGPCTGALAEEGVFTAPSAEHPVTLVIGPQGSRMLVLAARTRGIDPGDPARPSSSANPLVELLVTDEGGHELSRYRGRAAFVPDAADPTWLVQSQIFVIMEGSLPPRLHALGTLRDRLGAQRCGTLLLTLE